MDNFKDVYVIMLEGHNVWSPKLEVFKSWWNAEYKEPIDKIDCDHTDCINCVNHKYCDYEKSSSEIPNKSIEEKCPCYYCEHFEIKGWSHCKIHEDAYGDSRCNDYHKVNQDLTKVKQGSNKSEIPTSSADENNLGVEQDLTEKISKQVTESHEEFIFETIRPYCENVVQMKISKRELERALLKYYGKKDLAVDAVSRKELLKIYEDRFSELQKLKHLKDNKGAEDRQMGVNYCINILKELPPVTPIRPKGHWILTDVEGNKVWHCHCSECGKDPQNYVGGSENWWLIKNNLPKFCPSCGSDNREVEE